MDGTEISVALTEGINEACLRLALNLLPSWRREYIEKKPLSEQINGAFSYLLLQRLTAERFGVSDTARFTYGEHGKPYYSSIKNVFFSMSHCKTAVAAAVSEKEIGIDVMDDRYINEGLAFKICSESELKKFNVSEDKQKFLRELWCKKESIVKKSGLGFTLGFKAADTEKAHCRVFYAKKYTVSAAAEAADTVRLSEIHFSELI
ncbi:MAG: 4'-phosphopantetheinyl transferase superfamily protein [Bacteroides sp.]|nr:4'-phosphopantetheinyl transferase superfamily protein [Bacteroides sp.]